jgi:chemotaxis protein CheC
MTQLAHPDPPEARAVDRACELTSVGAGHAAGALATLLARPFEMRVPSARVVEAGAVDTDLAAQLGGDPRAWSGVLFDVHGGLGGTLALLLPPVAREALLAILLGENAGIEPQAESALREVGNIVASHAVSAMGALLGTSVLPSPPQLEAEGAASALAAAVAARAGEGSVLRIAVELRDRADALPMLLVYVPESLG